MSGHPLLEAAEAARQAVFEHAGFDSAYSYSTIDDKTDMNWYMNGKNDVIFWDDSFTVYQSTLRKVNSNGEFISIGKDYSIVMMESDFGGDPITSVLLNSKEAEELPEEVASEF